VDFKNRRIKEKSRQKAYCFPFFSVFLAAIFQVFNPESFSLPKRKQNIVCVNISKISSSLCTRYELQNNLQIASSPWYSDE
jgi:membrane protein YqaA with SNARE-associated domain